MTPGRGAEQLNVVLTQTGGVTKTVIYIYTQYIYMYFARGMFQKHFEQRLTLIQPPDKVARNYILIYRGGQKLHFIASSEGGGWGGSRWGSGVATHAQAPESVGWKWLPGTSEETTRWQQSSVRLSRPAGTTGGALTIMTH